ncbi:hypothetical protein Y023_5125 [Burkholderia pseudomallei A79D]|nr:hypothetical protein Y023_5125 [Burkholderia pseudomallei A79D]KGX97299.1 hypothetical protein X997_4808 [Burkholderia pseudomallei A79C]
MCVIGVAIIKKLGQPTAAAIRKEAGFRWKVAANHIGDLHERTLFELHLFVLVSVAARHGLDHRQAMIVSTGQYRTL